MNTREIGEIRRHVRRERCNMTAIYGCYVNGQKEIVSTFRQSVATMPESEAEKYFGALKRTLCGTIGKNLVDIPFRTAQVADSQEHRLLMQLRKTSLEDEASRNEFFNKAIQSITLEDNYVILIGCDCYDVPFKSNDDALQQDASDETYQYLLCAVCPVKQTKSALCYDAKEKEFHDGGIFNIVSAPELGFLFPAFDNRSTNIYNALFYTKSAKHAYQSFVDAVFNVQAPKPAAEQKKSFEALLTTTLGEDCSLDAVQGIHDTLCQYIALHKQSKVKEPLLISKEQVKASLEESGVSEKNIAKFSVDFDSEFGVDAQLHPRNIIDNRKVEIKTPDVVIKVNPERSDLIETRVIGGVKYILICADENVEVNGVSIHIDNKE